MKVEIEVMCNAKREDQMSHTNWGAIRVRRCVFFLFFFQVRVVEYKYMETSSSDSSMRASCDADGISLRCLR